MILEEIKLYDADIMSLQEVDNVDTFYKEALSKLGYELTFYHYPSKHHGNNNNNNNNNKSLTC